MVVLDQVVELLLVTVINSNIFSSDIYFQFIFLDFVDNDSNPANGCSSEAHGIYFYRVFYDLINHLTLGTHVAGIVGADASKITQAGFVPAIPFVGVAPQVTISSCKCIFLCI